MTSFQLQVVGLAEAIIAVDCGALHRGNWRLPCPSCVAKENELRSLLDQAITDDMVRRHIRRGHDERDGNTPKATRA